MSEALLFAAHGENMLCTNIALNVRNKFCTQHVLPRFELRIFMYWTCNSMNNLSSYCGLVDAKIRASDKDLPVLTNRTNRISAVVLKKYFLLFLVTWHVKCIPRYKIFRYKDPCSSFLIFLHLQTCFSYWNWQVVLLQKHSFTYKSDIVIVQKFQCKQKQ